MRNRIVHRIAHCHNCRWGDEDMSRNILGRARRHAEKYGHKVSVEMGYTVTYDGKETTDGQD